jgi:Fungal Zn(2)-Cys(6) binuclear cluster domain
LQVWPQAVHEETHLCNPFVIARSRRVKCDESKPQCSRCQRSNVECEGYPSRAYSDESKNELGLEHSGSQASESQFDAVSTRESHPTYALLDGFRRSHTQDRLARLGCSILRGGLHDQFEASRALFECLLPQLSHALPSVNAAAAALGAIYEMQTASLSTGDGETRLIATQYGTAIREVQLELLHRPYGPVPILVACVLLACADVLLRRPRIALIHFRGAIKLLEERYATSIASMSRPVGSSGGVCDHLTPKMDPLPLEEEDDDITVFLRTLDVQTVLYADGLEPQMHIAHVRTPQDPTSTTPNSIYRAGRELIALIQACHCFTSFASQYKYCPRIIVPAELFVEQGRQIAALKLWLRRLNYIILPSIKPSADSSGTASSKYTHGLMLRNLCLANIIYASTILDPYETDWDVHAGDFQEIIIGAESILDNRHRRRCGTPSSQTLAFTFTPSPGIIQPLFLAGLKYREPRWRRRALELLWQSGKEGPWDGKLIAAATQRTIEIEESERVRDVESSIGKGQAGVCYDEHAGRERLANIVPEHVRISSCGPGNDGDGGGISDWEWTKEWAPVSQGGSMDRRNVSPVSFSRCRDVDKMLAEGLDGKAGGEEAPWKDNRHWEMWTETIEF